MIDSSLSVTETLGGYRAGAFDPTEVVDACLSRMDALDASIHAVVTRADDQAREAAAQSAERWQAGTPRPLEGVPVAVKDIIETAEITTAAGSPLFTGHVPSADATVVDRLRRAGAIVVAKTATPEFAFGDESGDGVVNPWQYDRWAGGSSSGSAAALASHQVALALGTDTGGSIRVPSSYCGVSGLKPTFGRVPRTGVFPVSWTLDHVGPMARTVADLALALDVIAGASAADPYASSKPVPAHSVGCRNPSLAGVTIGAPAGWLEQGCTPAVTRVRDAALATFVDLGADVVTVDIPHAELAGTIAWLITVVEFAAHHDERLDQIEAFTPSAAQRLAAGASTSARDYLKALRARHLVQQDFDAVFDQVDLIVTPATPSPAPDPATFFDDGDRLWLDKVARNFLIFNLTGMPALVVPAGFDEGLPVAIQIAAPPHEDLRCLQAGAAFQQATDHHRRRPGFG